MFFARKRSDSGNVFCLRESEATAATAQCHEGVITLCDGFSLRSSIVNPQGVAQSPLQSTDSHDVRFNKMSSNFLVLPEHFQDLSPNF